jgi:predicted transcriptional regulator
MGLLKFSLRGFKPPGDLYNESLGKLEQATLEAVWYLGEASVRQVQQRLGEEFAYTTLMTTLDRLHKKGLLERRKEGRAFLYQQTVSRRDIERGIVAGMIDGLLGRKDGHAEPVLACIVDAVGAKDYALLDELERLVQEKKRERGE